MTEPAAHQPRGIGGWLIMVAIQLVLFDLLELKSLIEATGQAVAAADTHAVVKAGLRVLFGPKGYIVMAVNLVLFFFFRRRQETRTLMTGFYALSAAGVVAFASAYQNRAGFAAQHPVPSYPVPLVLALVLNLSLLAYVQTSVRVRNTFVGRAAPAAEPAGIGGGLLLALVAIALITACGVVAMVTTRLPARMMFAIAHGHWPALVRQIAMVALLLVYTPVCAVSALRRRRAARWLMIGYFGIWTVVTAATLWHQHVMSRGGLASGAICLAFIAYLWSSGRVKKTLVC